MVGLTSESAKRCLKWSYDTKRTPAFTEFPRNAVSTFVIEAHELGHTNDKGRTSGIQTSQALGLDGLANDRERRFSL